jgi:hypothetical protein
LPGGPRREALSGLRQETERDRWKHRETDGNGERLMETGRDEAGNGESQARVEQSCSLVLQSSQAGFPSTPTP